MVSPLAALVSGQEQPLASPSVQYHIQTDHGPERFFKFQTLSGQYRKEQRHLDGSVTGTYGWVDPNSVLRLFDYISDAGGYRIEQERLYKVGQPLENRLVNIPTKGGDDIELGFEVLPLDDGFNVNVAPPPKRSASPQVAIPRQPVVAHAPVQISRLASTGFNIPVPYLGHPVHPVVPILHPRPVIYHHEPEPEPEPVIVIGSSGTTLPDAPEPQRRFVIGAAANGEEITRPLSRTSPAVGAAAGPRSPSAPASRSTTVIGAAANQGGRRISSRPAASSQRPSSNNGRSGIVIGLRHSNRRKRLAFV